MGPTASQVNGVHRAQGMETSQLSLPRCYGAQRCRCGQEGGLFFCFLFLFSQMAQANYSHLCSPLHLCRFFFKMLENR